MMTLKSNGLAAAITGLLIIGATCDASAHTPYLLPNAFDVERDHVTLQGALTEDDYFNPDIAIKATSYIETSPSGQKHVISPSVVLKDLALIEAPIEGVGTYRFSTGEYVARTAKMAQINGQWMMVRPVGAPERHEPDHASGGDTARPASKHFDGPHGIAQSDVPANAQTVQVESILTAETYVSKGAPTNSPLQPNLIGLELVPITHPNSIFADEGFSFKFLINGKPAANIPITVYRSGNSADENKISSEIKTDIAGATKIHFDRPGVYLLTAHYPLTTPEASKMPSERNYLYSLTFEVTR